MGQVRSKKGMVREAAGLVLAGVRQLARPRAQFADYAGGLMELYRDHVQELFIAGFDPAVVLDELGAYRSVLDEEHAMAAQLAQVRETRLEHASNVWSAMLAVYQRARSARSNPAIRHAIAGFEQFMKVRRHKKPATAPLAG